VRHHHFETRALVRLQSVARRLDLDQPVAARSWIKLDEIGKARSVGSDVAHHPVEPRAQMLGRKAIERCAQQALVDETPRDERRSDPMALREASENGLAVLAGLQLREAPCEFLDAPAVETRAGEIGRTAMKGVEKSPWNRREHGRPAQQAEQ
jgi:hypothetical protein